jgi:hypothetical protein
VFRSLLRGSSLLALLFTAGFALAQTGFSADIVDHGKEKNAMTKVYLGKDKIRFDSADKTSGGAIMDLHTGDFLVIMPQQHMYMVMPADKMEDHGSFRFLVFGDVEDACTEWLRQSTNKGGSCKKDGDETVNGRSTVKYEGTNSKGESTAVWLDTRLHFPIKWEGKNGGGELQNIKEGPQPDSLFEVPSGFAKMDMGAMMQQRNK